MFTVYKSNSLNTLLLKAYQIIQKKPLSNIFEKEIFIYDNNILFQYLNVFFAEKKGISANFKLYHPNNFIWKLFRIMLSEKELKNRFTHSTMIWKIMKVLDNKKFLEYYDNKKDEIAKFKFSFLMANIFKQYIFYRPNWINAWETEKNISEINKNEIWQKKLWMKVIYNEKKINQSIYHFSNFFYIFSRLMQEKKINKKYLPNRLFIISSFALNPSYIKIFKNISVYINIYFLYITPFEKNIFNLIQSKNVNCNNKQNISRNSLITLWGKYEKIYNFYIIKSKEIKTINYFKKNKNNSLLNNIKNDLLHGNQSKKTNLKLNDHSISIHICFSKKNEIEILYKNLLIFFGTHSSIKPRDIVVISFSLDSYIPHINSVFKSIDNKKQIPFFISKKLSKKTELILSSFKKILNLSKSRFENEEILEFLDIPEIAQKFNFSEEEIKILYNWIEEANIRWAIDSKHKNHLLFPKNKQNTWFYGIEKLLLSYAMNDTEKIWNNVLSCSLVNGSRAELIGKLIIFIKILQKWQKKLSRSQHIKYWYSLSEKLISDFFYISERIESSIQKIKTNWIEMINDSLSSNYEKKVSINILEKNFLYKFYKANDEIFLPGVVNFCHPLSICYIPFKIICIIGADHISVPKKNYLDNFNLLTKYPLIGDIDIYQKYCYLFSQIISCAEKYFYISYIGYSLKDESKRYPAIFVDQLLNYIAFHFCFIEDQNLNLEDNTKKIIQYLCKKYPKEYFYEKKNINSYTQKNLENSCKHIEKTLYNTSSLKEKKYNKIHLKDLIIFWKNPIRYFFNVNLKVKMNKIEKKNNTTEPFVVNTLDSFNIKNMLLKKIINNQDITTLFQYYMLSGKLPYHFFGKIFWNKNVKDMRLIAKEIIKHRISTKEKKINLKIEKYQIYGVLSEIQNTGLLRWKTSAINYNDRIALWLEHLIYSILGGFGESIIIGHKSQIWSFCSLNYDIAYNTLLKYIEGYLKGIKEPLLLTKSGASWLDQSYDIKKKIIKKDYDTQIKAHKKLLDTWMGNNYIKGEKEDFYIKKTIAILNKKNTKKICETAKKWLIPILKNKKIRKK